MSISYLCPACGREHKSRLMALRRTVFDDVIPCLGEVSEICPETDDWVTVDHSQMSWHAKKRDRIAEH